MHSAYIYAFTQNNFSGLQTILRGLEPLSKPLPKLHAMMIAPFLSFNNLVI